MRKKKLYILPVIVLVIVSIMSISVLAAGSPELNLLKAWGKNGKGTNITDKFIVENLGTEEAGYDLTKIKGLQKEITAKDSKLKISDFKLKVAVYVDKKLEVPGEKPWRFEFPSYTVPKGYVYIVVHDHEDGSQDHVVENGAGKAAYMDGIQGCSPFYVYAAKAKSSAQTGDFVPMYVALISVGLLTCGAFFALRAKKETK